MKRIEYFKSFAKEDEAEDRFLLKTIHMPKNLLFLSDNLPKPNYEQQLKSTNNPNEDNTNKNLYNFNKDNIIKSNSNNEKEILNKNMKENMNKHLKLVTLSHKRKDKEKLNIIQNYYLKNKEDYKISPIESNLIRNKNLIENKIGLNKIKINHELDKNDLVFQNNKIRLAIMNRIRLNNDSSTKYLNPIKISNVLSKSAPKKIDNNKLINNKCNIQIPYLKTINNHQNLNIQKCVLPRISRRLIIPLK